MKQPTKKAFFSLLNKAIKPLEEEGETPKQEKSDDYSDKKTHQHKTTSKQVKQRGKSH